MLAVICLEPLLMPVAVSASTTWYTPCQNYLVASNRNQLELDLAKKWGWGDYYKDIRVPNQTHGSQTIWPCLRKGPDCGPGKLSGFSISCEGCPLWPLLLAPSTNSLDFSACLSTGGMCTAQARQL